MKTRRLIIFRFESEELYHEMWDDDSVLRKLAELGIINMFELFEQRNFYLIENDYYTAVLHNINFERFTYHNHLHYVKELFY